MILQPKLFGKIFLAGADAHRVHGDPGILQPIEPQRDADGDGRREEAGIQRRKGEQAAEALRAIAEVLLIAFALFISCSAGAYAAINVVQLAGMLFQTGSGTVRL